MARVKGKSIIKDVQGMIGKTIVVRKIRGETFISNRPSKRKHLSAKQEVIVRNFTTAQRYARLQLKDPRLKKMYQTGITPEKTSAHAVAAYDYLHAPKIHYIKAPAYDGTAGCTITVKATDDFRVASVEITITDGKGARLEAGSAARYRLKPFIWKYKTTIANTAIKGTIISATASDHAANKVSLDKAC